MTSKARRMLSKARSVKARVLGTPRVEEIGVEAGYRRWAPTYGDAEAALLGLEDELRAKLQPSAQGLRVLDLGCGRGRSSRLAHEHGAGLCIGVDPVLGMLLRPLPEVAQLPRALAHADSLPFCDASFDLTVSAMVLGHLTRLRPALHEVRRVLSPGGVFVATVFHPAASARGWQRTFREQASGRTFAIRTENRSFEQYGAAFARAGFETEAVEEARYEGEPVVLGFRTRIH